MILESIELTNFMCYAGTNKFEFTEGINVIIGDNGYGKSKLYDAFYWVMYNRCFDTSIKKFAETSTLKRLIVSDKAIKEQEDGSITASVILTFRNTEKDSVYILERRYTVNKSGETIKEDQDSEEIIWFKELSFLTAREVIEKEEVKRIKDNILPDNIKPYMWFQGEQVESIIDFNKSDTLTQAINTLSNITRFDKIIDIAQGLKESSSREFNKKQRDLSSNKGESERLEVERQNLLGRIKALELLELQIKDNLATAEEKSETLLNQLTDAKNIREIEARRNSIEKNLIEVQEEYNDEQKSLHKRMFTDKWILKGTEKLFEDYSKIYGEFERKKLQNEASIQAKLDAENALLVELQARLPIDVPEPIHLEHMLSIEKCLVCDREALKESEPWLKIKELMDRSKMKIKTLEDTEITTHNFSGDLKKLYHNGLGLSHNIKDIDDNIASIFRRLKRLDKRRKSLSEELSKIESEKNSLIVNASLNVSQANNLLNEYLAQNELVKRSIAEITSNANIVSKKREDLAKIEAELNKLVIGEIPAYLLEKVKVLEEFYQVAHSTRKRVFSKLVKMLEVEANKHYMEMTQENMSSRGVIKLKELSNGKNYMPELVDEKGNVLLQLNTGNIILIKLATIMAIISARQGSRDTDLYTLITDAPMSVFGEDYTIGFCKTVSKVYRQSIIMSKEFYKNLSLRKQLLTDTEIKLGKVYLITPSIQENIRSNRNSLSTNIEKLN
ncbi:AAA family ATPase [Emticicia fluvialis]|uniref:AAA family ATPase n=1 Tax=Emticicia fluvialis TaxID=2974474 RepID=UPI00216501D2|nr:AAA family ATPase [Emticicia fluvialis]